MIIVYLGVCLPLAVHFLYSFVHTRTPHKSMGLWLGWPQSDCWERAMWLWRFPGLPPPLRPMHLSLPISCKETKMPDRPPESVLLAAWRSKILKLSNWTLFWPFWLWQLCKQQLSQHGWSDHSIWKPIKKGGIKTKYKKELCSLLFLLVLRLRFPLQQPNHSSHYYRSLPPLPSLDACSQRHWI